MSHYWHGHWTNEAFMPVRLRNWEVPNWHPGWPDRHCTPTRFICNERGHILEESKKLSHSAWGNFKGTWELPLKISRKKAIELSSPPRYKINAWLKHEKANQMKCDGKHFRTDREKRERDHVDSFIADLAMENEDIGKHQESELCLEQPDTSDTPEILCLLDNECQ